MSPIDPRLFRQLMGRFATGVCVVATEVSGEVRALTVNSFTSVSLNPLLVLWCLDKRTKLAAHIHELQGYGVSVLAADQHLHSSHFAGQLKDQPAPPHRFEPMAGGPRLAGAIAALGCRLERVDEGGDHWILLGRVEAMYLADEPRDPLIWFGGKYRGLRP